MYCNPTVSCKQLSRIDETRIRFMSFAAMDTPSGERQPLYHAAYVPEVVRNSYTPFEPKDFVSPNKASILSIVKSGMKNHKGYRFKSFDALEEALHFVTDDTIDKSKPKTNGPTKAATLTAELAPPFPSIDISEISAFKRAIESRNYETTEAYISRNGRFLVSFNADSPTILKSGPRYNACHLAVRANAPDILHLILATIDSREFMRRCYPESSNELLEEKRTHLLDLYLNTPDKVCFNTPLHFACENGSLECLRILLGYAPQCDTAKRNKRGLTPIEMVRKPELRPKIEEMFESCLYITITRNEESFRVLEPVYGRPTDNNSANDRFDNSSPMKTTAIAGPMSPQYARIVFDLLKSPKKNSDRQRQLRRSDFSRGLERVAKEVCGDLRVPIEEYWAFMEQFADFGTQEGLAKLNQHLQKMHDQETKHAWAMARLERDFANTVNLNEDVQALDEQGGDSSDNDSVYYTPPTSPLPEQPEEEDEPEDDEHTPFFVTGGRCTKADEDVCVEIEASLQHNLISLEMMREKFPFVFQWYKIMSSNKATY